LPISGNKTLGIIPLRMASSRLPGKPLLKLGEKFLFQIVADIVSKSCIDKLIIATESPEIISVAEKFPEYNCILTPKFKSGSDRVAWVSRKFNKFDVVVNIQGDEPFLKYQDIDKCVAGLIEDKNAVISTLFIYSENEREFYETSTVKIVSDINNYAIYFSRAPIPYPRDKIKIRFKKHIGLYVYRKNFLEIFSKRKQSDLEKIEKLEQLRILEFNDKIKIIETENDSFGIDTQKDYERAKEKFIKDI